MAEADVAIVSLSIVLLTGILASRIAEEFNFPKTIPLLLTGILLAILSNIGVSEIVLDIEAIRDMAILTAELALITILFKEGMHLHLKNFIKYGLVIGLIAVFGTILTTLIVGMSVYIGLINFSLTLSIALLIGAIFTPTDPAATFAALRGGGKDTKIDEKFETILGGESALNDVIAIILVVVILIPSATSLGSSSSGIEISGGVLIDAFWQFFGGIFIGFILGYFTLLLINKLPTRTEESMVSLACTILIFGLGFIIGVSSAIGALIAGIIIGNPKYFKQPEYSQNQLNIFWDNLTFLFEIMAFVFIGAEFSLTKINLDILFFSLILSILVMLGRFVGIFAITSIFQLFESTKDYLNNKERFFVSFAGMKGLTTGILAILAYLAFQGSNLLIGQTILYSSILVIIITGLIQGVYLKDVAKKSGVLQEFNELELYMAQKIVLRASLDFLIKKFEDQESISSGSFGILSLPIKEELLTLEEKLILFQSEANKDVNHLEITIKMNEYAMDVLNEAHSKGEISNDIAYEFAVQKILDSNKEARIKHHRVLSTSEPVDYDQKKIEATIIEVDSEIQKVESKVGQSLRSFFQKFQKSS